MAGPIASTTESALHTENVRTSLQLAFFAICLSLAQAVFMVVFRTGLPTPVLSYTIGPAILICTVLGPTLWASRAPGRVKWIGPLAVAVFLASFVLVAFGIVLQVLIFAAALFLLARALLTTGRPSAVGRAACPLAGAVPGGSGRQHDPDRRHQVCELCRRPAGARRPNRRRHAHACGDRQRDPLLPFLQHQHRWPAFQPLPFRPRHCSRLCSLAARAPTSCCR